MLWTGDNLDIMQGMNTLILGRSFLCRMTVVPRPVQRFGVYPVSFAAAAGSVMSVSSQDDDFGLWISVQRSRLQPSLQPEFNLRTIPEIAAYG